MPFTFKKQKNINKSFIHFTPILTDEKDKNWELIIKMPRDFWAEEKLFSKSQNKYWSFSFPEGYMENRDVAK